MAKIRFENGVVVEFNGNPTAQDVEEVARKLGLSKISAKKTFTQDVKNIIKTRADKLSTGYQAQMAGKQTRGESVLQTLGQTAGAAGDILFSGASRALSGITPDFIEKPVVSGATKLLSKAVQTPLVSGAMSKYQQFSEENPRAARNIGAVANIATALPVGKATQVGTKLAGKTALKTAKLTTKSVEKTAGAGTKLARFGVSQASGIGQDTIESIVKSPQFFTKKAMDAITRESLGKQIKNQINSRLKDLSSIGKEYETIRSLPNVVKVDKNIYKNALSKFGLKTKAGQIIKTAESRPFSSGELSKISDFIEQYGGKELSANAILNAREALSEMAKFGTDKTSSLIQFAKTLRKDLDNIAKESVPGLKDIDIKYSAEKSILNEIKKDYFKRGTSEFKDNALSKIANLTKEGRQNVLERLKQIDPNIETKVNILRAVEDVKASGGLKVGTYSRAGLAVGGLATGNPALLLTAIAAQPQILVPILRTYGQITKATKSFTDDVVKKIQSGLKLATEEKKFIDSAVNNYSKEFVEKAGKIKGLTIEDVSPKGKGEILKSKPLKTTNPLIQEAKKYKSADEFIKAQPTVYHGTAGKFDTFDDKMTGSVTGAKSAHGATWFTDDKDVAKAYSIYAAESGPINKLQRQADELDKIARKSGKESDWEKYDKVVEEMEKLDTYDANFKRRELANVKEAVLDGDFYKVDAKGKSPQELSADGDIDSWLSLQVKKAKDLKKDGLIIENIDDAVGLYDKPSTHYAIFDTSKIKTKSQLTEIWNKANKKLKK